MKVQFRHLLALICVLLCSNASGQAATYTVKPGDSLSKIARSQGCTVEALARANQIKLSAVIQAGQTLKLPGKAVAATTSGNSSHIVQSGDTFSSISRQYNTTVELLQAANPGLDPKSLKPGQKIQLSSASKSSAAKSSASKADAPQKSDPIEPVAPPEKPAPPAGKNKQVAATETEKPAEPAAATPPQAPEEKVRTVVVDAEMTFGEFAAQHGSDVKRLNELNGLDLTGATVLAKGSELYVPSQNQADP